ncbi:hypothetical protein [Microbulbifer sp. TYP-18]|uniref:hypothetical protein n=1 Tax=Microbulbifer sp. TYP-18 TaxID=3230024 RepID=UPI0034C6CED0
MFFKFGLASTSIIIFSMKAFSLDVGKKFVELDDIVNKYEYILRVNIIDSEVKYFYFNSVKHDCGIVYRADIIDSLGKKVKESKITFSSMMPMKTNANYLVFLTESPQFLRKKDFVVKNKESYLLYSEIDRCVEEFPSFNTNGNGVVFEFDETEEDGAINIIYNSPNILLPDEIDLRQRVYELCPYPNKNEKCVVQLIYQVFDWFDFRAMVLREQ